MKSRESSTTAPSHWKDTALMGRASVPHSSWMFPQGTCPAERKPQKRPRTDWRDNALQLVRAGNSLFPSLLLIKWRKCLGSGKSAHLCLDGWCYNPTPCNQEKMDVICQLQAGHCVPDVNTCKRENILCFWTRSENKCLVWSPGNRGCTSWWIFFTEFKVI